MRGWLGLLLVLPLIFGCGRLGYEGLGADAALSDRDAGFAFDSGTDTGTDAATDSATDAASAADSGADTGTDAATDGGADAATDAGRDAMCTAPEELRLSVRELPRSFDPIAEPPRTAGEALVFDLIYDALTRVDETGSVVPDLAESITPSIDYRTFNVVIRGGAKFADGTPVQSTDVVATFARFLQLEGGPTPEPSPLSLSLRDWVIAVRVVDETIVEFELDQPMEEFAYLLADVPITPSYIDAATLAIAPIGTGPYGSLMEGTIAEGRVRLERLDPWRDLDLYAARELDILAVDDVTALTQMDAGEIDLGLFTDRVAVDAALMTTSRLRLVSAGLVDDALDARVDLKQIVYVAINTRDDFGGSPLLENVDMRAALALGNDGIGAIRAATGMDAPASLRAYPFDDLGLEWDTPTLDMTGALALLSASFGFETNSEGHLVEAGSGDLVQLRLDYLDQAPYRAIAEGLIARYRSNIGLTVMPRPRTREELETVASSGDFDLLLTTTRPTSFEDYYGHWSVSATMVGANVSGYVNAEVEELLVESRAASLVSERRSARAQVIARAEAEVPWLPLYVMPAIFVWNETQLEGGVPGEAPPPFGRWTRLPICL